MQRTSTTVVALVGERARSGVEALGRAANVVAHVADPDRTALERAVDAWAVAARTHSPYFVHDADPLTAVADAWVRRYDEEGPVGELEVAVTETVARWRARSIELPDYYLVLDAETWGPTRRHWYLGVLHDAGPARVVPAIGDPLVLADTLAHLSAGRWWPDVDRLLDGIDRVVPDQIGRTSSPA
jgi:hypothetical protein